MSTEDRGLGDPVTPTDPEGEDQTPTPVGMVSTTATPEEVTTRVEVKGDLVEVTFSSEHTDGMLLLEPEPARELLGDIGEEIQAAAANRAEDDDAEVEEGDQ